MRGLKLYLGYGYKYLKRFFICYPTIYFSIYLLTQCFPLFHDMEIIYFLTQVAAKVLSELNMQKSSGPDVTSDSVLREGGVSLARTLRKLFALTTVSY